MWRVMLIVCLLGAPPWQWAEAANHGENRAETPRVALVIGNGSYPDAPLGNPERDALAMTRTLRSLGFDVINHENATRRGMLEAIREFKERLGGGGVGLFYFAGHGFRVGNRTILLPVDADGRTPARLLTAGIDLQTVLAGMAEPRPGKLNLLVLDTCLNNPFLTGDGPSPVPPAQTLIAYATTPGHLAADGDRHGLYTSVLLKALMQAGRDVREVFEGVQSEVWRTSQHQQLPMLSSSLTTRFTFRETAHGLSTEPLLAASGDDGGRPMQYRGILPKDSAEQYELAFWESVKDSNFAADYEAYLQAYPKGRFAGLARARLERLRASAPPKAAAPERTPSPPATRAAPERAPTARTVPERSQPAPPTPRAVPAPVSPAPATASPQKMPSTDSAAISEVKDCPACPALITLPRGTFTMGNNANDPSEKPVHQVSIKEPFAIGKFEVTAEQWNACAAAEACPRIATNASVANNAPVRDVSWDDAQQYVKWLSKVSGKSYRLPTEAEWEYAARGGTATRFWWGDQMRPGNANCKGCGDPWEQKEPAKVGTFAANSYGLHDTSGSVWEWVSDCWHTSYHGAPTNGQAWNEPNCTVRVIRGGSWRDGPTYMPSSTRFKYDASVRNAQNGFRVARDIE